MNAQDFLTTAATIVEVSAFVLTIAGIVATAFQPVPTVAQPAPATTVPEVPAQTQEPQQPEIQEAPEVAQIVPVASIVQQRPRTQSSANRKRSNCEILRQQCAEQGITWRNANGKGKHLSTQEMQHRLGHLTVA